ncbi:helix-turn-helix domain-containing protein [Amycolatopsis sp. NPDC059021]|uniref:helix-turn-helix domain-containing protein n=1 Tax=Amycolatopsis sp. NPDC059021 TaxID=3346704 RepID=UPI00366B63E4
MFEPDDLIEGQLGLGEALRMLRKAQNLAGDRLALRAHMSQSKISRIETGKILPSVLDVERIVHALGVAPEESARLLQLARAANTDFESRRRSRQRGSAWRQQDFSALMSQAKQVRYVLPTMLAGLLQIREYVRSDVFHPLSRGSESELNVLVEAKLARQSVLDDPAKEFRFLLTEAAVRCRVADAATMAAQVEHLVNLSRRGNVELMVIPLAAQFANVPINIFAVYDERLVTVEMEAGTLALRDPADVAEHLELFAHFRRHALEGDACRAFLHGIADEFRREL